MTLEGYLNPLKEKEAQNLPNGYGDRIVSGFTQRSNFLVPQGRGAGSERLETFRNLGGIPTYQDGLFDFISKCLSTSKDSAEDGCLTQVM